MGLCQDVFEAVVIHCSEWEILAGLFISGHVTVTHKLVSNSLEEVYITEGQKCLQTCI